MSDGKDKSDESSDSIIVYRGMTKTQLDAGYNNTEAVEDSSNHIENWTKKSERLRDSSHAILDIEYGPKPRNKIDFFQASTPDQGLFIFLHGGYWQRNNKEMFAYVSEGLNSKNINVATIGYTLGPDASLTQIVSEVRAAIDYLVSLSEKLKFDAQRTYLGGWSAGGHLSANLVNHPSIKGIISISGIFDLEPISKCYLNENLNLSPEEIAELSPITHETISDKKIILYAGERELPELRRQSESYASKLIANSSLIEHALIEDKNHYTIMDELQNQHGVIASRIEKLMSETF